jgi:hypothetical protein
MNNNINWRWVGIGFVVFVVLAGAAGRVDYEEELRAEQAYCDNVKLYKDSRGQQGWPDYRELYNTMCAPQSEKNQKFSNT